MFNSLFPDSLMSTQTRKDAHPRHDTHDNQWLQTALLLAVTSSRPTKHSGLPNCHRGTHALLSKPRRHSNAIAREGYPWNLQGFDHRKAAMFIQGHVVRIGGLPNNGNAFRGISVHHGDE